MSFSKKKTLWQASWKQVWFHIIQVGCCKNVQLERVHRYAVTIKPSITQITKWIVKEPLLAPFYILLKRVNTPLRQIHILGVLDVNACTPAPSQPLQSTHGPPTFNIVPKGSLGANSAGCLPLLPVFRIASISSTCLKYFDAKWVQ